MAICYKPLWHLLLEKEMNKEDLKRAANITSNIVSRMSKNAYVNLDSIEKICLAMDCKIEDDVRGVMLIFLIKKDYLCVKSFKK